ncbi:MAG: ABC transporter permease [Lysobacterales bacterium]|nr:MAG: ABC transporter permease [Xanthomonadales bacterium]
MPFLLKVALRNIRRHRRRSLVTLATVASAVIGIVLFGGFIEANYTGLRESVIRSQYGHAQIHVAGYEAGHRADPDKVRLSPETAEAVRTLLEKDKHVLMSSRRIEFAALLGNEKTSQAVIVRGVDPDTEALINSALTIIAGDELAEDDADGVLLGEGLAQALNVKPGATLTMLGSTVDGTMNAVDVRVAGIFRSFASEYDDRAVMMGMRRAGELLGTPSVDTVVVLLDDTAALDGVMERFGAAAHAAGLKLEWQTWAQLASYYHKVVALYDGFFLFIALVIVVVVMFGITNTMLVAVMERTAEIGTLRALGTRRGGIVRQFLTEGVVLGTGSALIGVVLGIVAAHGITALEIMMPAPPGSSKGFPLRIEDVPGLWVGCVLAVAGIAAFATLLPAVRAARQPVVTSLRHV